MKKTTAVEWLIKEIQRIPLEHRLEKRHLYMHALQKEREQIEEAYSQGMMDEIDHRLDDIDIPSPEYYYNETYLTDDTNNT